MGRAGRAVSRRRSAGPHAFEDQVEQARGGVRRRGRLAHPGDRRRQADEFGRGQVLPYVAEAPRVLQQVGGGLFDGLAAGAQGAFAVP
ncbi:hypothetical protein RB200_33945 [Streptomyces sp. PmtG]